MKWMKRAVKKLTAAAMALCLLLPCSVQAAATALQTPDWMKQWGDTRTASVIAQLEKDQFTAELKVDGIDGLVDLVRSNGKMYLKTTKEDGTEGMTLLVRDGSAYQLDHARRLAIRLGDEAAAYSAIGLSENAVIRSLSGGKATGYTTAKKTINKKTYDAEIFDMQLDGKALEMTYCYENGTLRYLITQSGGKSSTMEYLSVSDKADESLLQIPTGYTVCTKGADGKLYDAAGKAIA